MAARCGKRPHAALHSSAVVDRAPALLPSFRLDVGKDGVVVDSLAAGARACTVFGRDSVVCDVCLDHPSVSRHHAAVLVSQERRAFALDLGSAHGTFVNNEKLTPSKPVLLQSGQVLRFGLSTRTFTVRGLPHAAEDAALFGVSRRPIPMAPPVEVDGDLAQELLAIYHTALNKKLTTAVERSSSPCLEDEQPQKKRRKIAFSAQAEFVSRSGDVHRGRHSTDGGGRFEGLVQTVVVANTPNGDAGQKSDAGLRTSRFASSPGPVSRARRRERPPPPPPRVTAFSFPTDFPFARFLPHLGAASPEHKSEQDDNEDAHDDDESDRDNVCLTNPRLCPPAPPPPPH